MEDLGRRRDRISGEETAAGVDRAECRGLVARHEQVSSSSVILSRRSAAKDLRMRILSSFASLRMTLVACIRWIGTTVAVILSAAKDLNLRSLNYYLRKVSRGATFSRSFAE
jgi:hypothetical protein